MNILILVFSFLAILAVTTTSFWNSSRAIRLETSSFCGYMAANRDAENIIQKKLYRNLPSVNTASKEKAETDSPKQKRSTVFHSHRLRSPPYPNARLNLSALWKDNEDAFVEGVFHRLLQQLYGHTAWFKEALKQGDIDALTASLIRFGREAKGSIVLHDLFSSLPSSQAELLYKMMKGTHTYALSPEKSGYPPLLDFVSLLPCNIKETCRFCFAPLPLLNALFDAKTAHEILNLEKKKWETDHKQHTCTKEELLALLQHRPTSSTQSTHLDTYFHFSKHSGKNSIISGVDPISGIHTEKQIKQ